MRRVLFVLIMTLACLCCLLWGGWYESQAQATERVSVDSNGVQGNQRSGAQAISSDGRYVAFVSEATNLVSGDTNGSLDVFVNDSQTGETTRVSVASNGAQADANSLCIPAISSDGGRYVAFGSEATNLVPGDTNGFSDIFVHDRQTGETTRVSVASNGAQGNGPACDGDNPSNPALPSISSDGRYVAFSSLATNMVTGDTNGVSDVFVHDRHTGVTTRVSVASNGAQGNQKSFFPAISSDGNYVAFISRATNMVIGDTNNSPDVFVRDRQMAKTTGVLLGSITFATPAISSDGRYVAFYAWNDLLTGDTNGFADIYVHDRQMDKTTLVSVASNGEQGNKDAEPFVAISSDGRYVAFGSEATNLVPGDTNGFSDVFVHDRQTGGTKRVSVASNGAQADQESEPPAISSDGRYVAFSSEATNLVTGDTNGFADVFVHDSLEGSNGNSGVGNSGVCLISTVARSLGF